MAIDVSDAIACAAQPVACATKKAAAAAMGDVMGGLAAGVLDAVGKAVASLGTLWVNVRTPDLTSTGGQSTIQAGEAPPGTGAVTDVLGYVTWISLAVAVASVILLGGLIATRMRRGEGIAAVGRLGLVLGSVVLITSASALVSGLLPEQPEGAGGTAMFLQSSLWWYVGGFAVLSVILGGLRMAWEQRAEPGRDLLRSLLTLLVVAGAGVTVTGLLVTASDSYATWVLDKSVECDLSRDGACFGDNMAKILILSGKGPQATLGSFLIIILGFFAILASMFQIVLMLARGGMLVILAGVLPLAASATNTEMGKSWFRKCVSWLVAFILYKPAAAIVYAAAFQLSGAKVFRDDGSGLISVLTGLMMMVLALFAMPALMRFVTPMVGSLAGGAGGAALAAGAVTALPTGAQALGRLGSGSGGAGGGDSGGGGVTSSPSGAGSGGAGGGRHSGPSGGGPVGGGKTAAGGGASGAASSGVGVGAATGAGAGGASAGGAAAAGGGAAAGAAAGPVGVAAGAAWGVAKGAGQAVKTATQNVAEESTGEGGPSGSR